MSLMRSPIGCTTLNHEAWNCNISFNIVFEKSKVKRKAKQVQI